MPWRPFARADRNAGIRDVPNSAQAVRWARNRQGVAQPHATMGAHLAISPMSLASWSGSRGRFSRVVVMQASRTLNLVTSRVWGSPTAGCYRARLDRYSPAWRGTDSDRLIVGFDTEFVSLGQARCRLLSYQLVTPLPGPHRYFTGCVLVAGRSSATARPAPVWFVALLMRHGVLTRWPRQIGLAFHWSRADLPAFQDWRRLRWEVDGVQKTFCTLVDPFGVAWSRPARLSAAAPGPGLRYAGCWLRRPERISGRWAWRSVTRRSRSATGSRTCAGSCGTIRSNSRSMLLATPRSRPAICSSSATSRRLLGGDQGPADRRLIGGALHDRAVGVGMGSTRGRSCTRGWSGRPIAASRARPPASCGRANGSSR